MLGWLRMRVFIKQVAWTGDEGPHVRSSIRFTLKPLWLQIDQLRSFSLGWLCNVSGTFRL